MDASISLSFELILLLNWLQKNEKPLLDALVKHAFDHGFIQQLEHCEEPPPAHEADHFYASILEFLLYLEKTLAKNLDSISVDEATSAALSPTLKKLDFENIDLKAVWLSMQQTKNRLARIKAPSKQNSQDQLANDQASIVLFEQLLKNWKPNKKEPLN